MKEISAAGNGGEIIGRRKAESGGGTGEGAAAGARQESQMKMA
jgi:hypothetical protein